MVYLIIGLAILFASLGYLITEKNARYLLSGYNTMREEDRKKFDLKAFLNYFKKFHLFLGSSLLILGIFLLYTINETVAGIFMAIYPILAYSLLAWRSKSFGYSSNKKSTFLPMIIMFLSLFFVAYIFTVGLKEDKLIIGEKEIIIKGFYGEKILFSEIASLKMIEKIPEIRIRTNGFSTGSVNKGYFKTKEGESVKLIINADQLPCLEITKKDGRQILFSSRKESNESIYTALIQKIDSEK
ncbi:MAG: DUF3784 domain-containing protein [Bacteroidales bacterium]|nr:DUF3784 domain-containing protein [Bacteroidales bacterium]MDP2235485.1 DUF3784 domain-containing protein [Bacteroidales bacterium]